MLIKVKTGVIIELVVYVYFVFEDEQILFMMV